MGGLNGIPPQQRVGWLLGRTWMTTTIMRVKKKTRMMRLTWKRTDAVAQGWRLCPVDAFERIEWRGETSTGQWAKHQSW